MKVAPVALSLNASFQFLGFSSGAALGSLTLTNASPLALGWVGAICVAAALSLTTVTRRRDVGEFFSRLNLDVLDLHHLPRELRIGH